MTSLFNTFKNSLSLSLPKRIADGEFFVFLHQYNLELPYQLKVSNRRKSLALELKRGVVTVRAPHWLTMEDIESFILAKQDWLLDKLQDQQSLPPSCQYQDGEQLLFLGHWYTLKLKPSRQYHLHLDRDDSSLTIYIPQRVKDEKKYVKAKLKAFYMEQAQEHMISRFALLQTHTGLQAAGVELKFFKTRWGCCYGSGLIRLNPMLMGAPEWVIDCVIIHELCHLKHMDHSAKFWQLNHKFCPNCDTSKKWLKQHGVSLHFE